MTAKTTPCICEGPGLCQRHGIKKGPLLFEKCATDSRYFEQGERRRMPQQTLVRHGVAASLADRADVAVESQAEVDGRDLYPCLHRGEKNGEYKCEICGGRTLETFACDVPEIGRCVVNATGVHESKHPPQFCGRCDSRQEFPARGVVIQNFQSLGDIAVLTAALRELHDQYPKQFATALHTSASELWLGNRLALEPRAGFEIVDWHYDRPGTHATIHESNARSVHFFDAACEGLSLALGLPTLRPKRQFAPSIFLTAEEKQAPPRFDGRPYWLVMAGYKTDYTAKMWPFYQEVVDRTGGSVEWVQVGSRDKNPGMDHVNEPLARVRDLTGQTSIRDLVRLVYHAQGVLCGVTGLMHLAHWVERPAGAARCQAVIVAGGREPTSWVAYPDHDVLHTIGRIKCCSDGGCWKSRVRKLGDGSQNDRSLCLQPVGEFPQCMLDISPELAAAHVLARAKE